MMIHARRQERLVDYHKTIGHCDLCRSLGGCGRGRSRSNSRFGRQQHGHPR
jgi:hypothetical protein